MNILSFFLDECIKSKMYYQLLLVGTFFNILTFFILIAFLSQNLKSNILNNIVFLINNFIFSLTILPASMVDKNICKMNIAKIISYVFLIYIVFNAFMLEIYHYSMISSFFCNLIFILCTCFLCPLFIKIINKNLQFDFIKIPLSLFECLSLSIRTTLIFSIENLVFHKICGNMVIFQNTDLLYIFLFKCLLKILLLFITLLFLFLQFFTTSILYNIILGGLLPKKETKINN